MSKVKASELVSRALHLADITNTDFLTHEELKQYINDAWKAFYQSVINKGDKAFVKRVLVGGNGRTKLPSDFYQMCSLRTYPGHSIINRASESSSELSNTYDIINDELVVNGYAGSQLELTYWTVPQYISFPDTPIAFNDVNVVSTAKDDILLSDGTLKNYKTGTVYGQCTLSDDLTTIAVGNGIVLSYGMDPDTPTTLLYQWFDVMSNNTLAEGAETNVTNVWDVEQFYVDENGNKYLTFDKGDDVYCRIYNRQMSYEHQFDWDAGYLYYDENGKAIMHWLDYEKEVPDAYTDVAWAPSFNGLPSLYAYDDNHLYRITFNEDGTADENDVTPKNKYTRVMTYYGPYSIDYIYSAEPDTEMNFPNNLFFELFSFELAVAFARKQNVDYSGLQQAYEDAQMRFMNTLSQDANYDRVINVYA